MSPRNVRAAAASTSVSSETAEVDKAFEHVVEVMREYESIVWNSIELFQIYTAEGVCDYTRRQLIQSQRARFGDKFLVLTATDVASIIVFKHRAPVLLTFN